MSNRDATGRDAVVPSAVLVPLVGPLHLTYPAYSTVTVLEIVQAAEPSLVVTTALAPGAFDDPLWRDTPELALPHTVVPWADAREIPVRAVGEPSPDPQAAADFARYAAGYPALRRAWQHAERLDAALGELLGTPLSLARIVDEALPRLAEAQAARAAAFGDGPATDWLGDRTAAMADRIAEAVAQASGPVAALVPLDHVPGLRDALGDRVRLRLATAPPPSEAARRRSLLDYAMRVDVAEPREVLRSLEALEGAEARYHEANILLANGHAAEALERLEAASRSDFSHPYWLPGYLLARLGQLYDLAGRRDAALRAYRGVRALSFAPAEAREAAAAGIDAPFDPGEGSP